MCLNIVESSLKEEKDMIDDIKNIAESKKSHLSIQKLNHLFFSNYSLSLLFEKSYTFLSVSFPLMRAQEISCTPFSTFFFWTSMNMYYAICDV